MTARYAPLPTQNLTAADRELDAAFGSEEEGEQLFGSASEPRRAPKHTRTLTDVYDFERDFDYVRPPPGSPSALAFPNDYGNSNGLVPSSPVVAPSHRSSFFHRAVHILLPARYTRLSTRTVGGGEQNDGVFTNVTARPSRPPHVGDDSVHVMPEETQSVAPPVCPFFLSPARDLFPTTPVHHASLPAPQSYAAAQADTVPPYWETTVHAPAGFDTDAGMIIDDLPSGSAITFVANLFTSFFFQFIGFLFTYLLHTTHAAKYGSRAGLGLTLIQYGFYSRAGEEDGFGAVETGMQTASRRSFSMLAPASNERPPSDGALIAITSREWLSFLLMTLGWFLLLSSLVGFWRIKRWEASIRASQLRASSSAEGLATRHALEASFQVSMLEDNTSAQAQHAQQELEDMRLQHDLRTAGLL